MADIGAVLQCALSAFAGVMERRSSGVMPVASNGEMLRGCVRVGCGPFTTLGPGWVECKAAPTLEPGDALEDEPSKKEHGRKRTVQRWHPPRAGSAAGSQRVFAFPE